LLGRGNSEASMDETYERLTRVVCGFVAKNGRLPDALMLDEPDSAWLKAKLEEEDAKWMRDIKTGLFVASFKQVPVVIHGKRTCALMASDYELSLKRA
jgi:hypothetical protein